MMHIQPRLPNFKYKNSSAIRRYKMHAISMRIHTPEGEAPTVIGQGDEAIVMLCN